MRPPFVPNASPASGPVDRDPMRWAAAVISFQTLPNERRRAMGTVATHEERHSTTDKTLRRSMEPREAKRLRMFTRATGRAPWPRPRRPPGACGGADRRTVALESSRRQGTARRGSGRGRIAAIMTGRASHVRYSITKLLPGHGVEGALTTARRSHRPEAWCDRSSRAIAPHVRFATRPEGEAHKGQDLRR
jgi:hypothetical protein